VAVDIDSFAVTAVAREIRNVVLAINFFDPPHDSIERAVHHQARNKPLGHFQLPVRRVRMAEVEWHRGVFSRRSPRGIIARRAFSFNHSRGAHQQSIAHGEASQVSSRSCRRVVSDLAFFGVGPIAS
jgi:hypothetical protein